MIYLVEMFSDKPGLIKLHKADWFLNTDSCSCGYNDNFSCKQPVGSKHELDICVLETAKCVSLTSTLVWCCLVICSWICSLRSSSLKPTMGTGINLKKNISNKNINDNVPYHRKQQKLWHSVCVGQGTITAIFSVMWSNFDIS